MNAFAKIRKALNTGDANDLLTAMDALAELERAAMEPVAWMWNDELGIPHASAGSKKPVWLESSASAEYIKQANLRPLYAAPPPAQPAPKFEAPEVTRPMCHGAWARFRSEPNSADSCDQARRWLKAWRTELGPTLGLVGLREPSDAECAAIHKEWLNAHGIQGYGAVQNGRAMFAAVAAYLRGELK